MELDKLSWLLVLCYINNTRCQSKKIKQTNLFSSEFDYNMSKIRVACATIICENEKILLVKENKEIAKDKYSLPCGKLEFGEEIIKCAIREAREETGLEVKILKCVGVYQRPASKEDTNTIFFVFEGVPVSGKVTISEDHPEIKYFSIKEIEKIEKEGNLRIKITLPAIKDFLAGQEISLEKIKPIY